MPKKKRETQAERHARAQQIIQTLAQAYPEPECALIHGNPFELLVATILSAQCTDERVNIVTANLFRKYRAPQDYLSVPPSELERDIHSTGFYKNKARSIQGACQSLVQNHGSQVPRTMEELRALPGVGRKTANVVLGNAFGIASGVVVDTHVTRLSQRLALTEQKTAEKIELDLLELVPEKHWIHFSHWLILHGRAICKARKPLCDKCKIEPLCPSSLLRA